MEKTEILNMLKKNLQSILPHIDDADFDPARSLEDLGANSIDRSEVIVLMLNNLALDVPMVEFANTQSIEELVERFHDKVAA